MKSNAAKSRRNRRAAAKMSEIMSRLPSVVSTDAPVIQRPRIVLAYGFKMRIEMQVMPGSGSINFGDSGTLANQIQGGLAGGPA
jgi:hypothetical protein